MTAVARLLLLAVLAGMVSVVSPSTSAWACSCEELTLAEQAASADLVARVEVLQVDDDDLARPIVYTVWPREVWKGDVGKAFRVETPQQESACGLPGIPEGEDLLLMGFVTSSGGYETGLCTGTRAATGEAVDEVVAALGPGTQVTGEPLPVDESTGDPGAVDPTTGPDAVDPWFTVAATVLAALLGVVLWQIFSRRRPPR